MKILISFSSVEQNFYRGIVGKFSEKVQKASHVIWVTQDRAYAEQYASSGDKNSSALLQYELDLKTGFNFGFRTLDTQVKFEEVLSRVRRGITDAFRQKLVQKDVAHATYDSLDELERSGYKRVWEWYMAEPKLADSLLKCGYTHIEALEGTSNSIRTVGILDKRSIRKIHKIWET